MTETSTALVGKTALVTGAGRGIGEAVAKGLAAAGAEVHCVARTSQDIEAVAAAIRGAGGSAHALVADVTSGEAMAEVASRIEAISGGLDIAFLNAGGNTEVASIMDSDPEAWLAAINLNLTSVFLGIRSVVPLMRKRGGGRILFTGSAMGAQPVKRSSSYCAAKGGARMLARVAAMELADDEITVNELVPGPTLTDGVRRRGSLNDPNSPFNIPNEWVKEPDAIVPLAVLLASYPGKGPTGQVFSLARR